MLTRRIIIPMLVPLLLLLVGTLSYRLIEGRPWSWLDALYMATITLTTVGYGETRPLSAAGRVFTIFYLLAGVFTIFFVTIELIRSLVSGEIREILGRSRMALNLTRVSDHFIVCGYGRMGQLVCKEFEGQKLPYVVIDPDEARGREFPTANGLFVGGDATSDEVLRRAGVDRARALITVVGSDADNLYITMSARLLNAKLLIVARTEEAAAEEKLRRAGADRVVSPYVIGGSRIAHAVLRPTVVDFLDLATRSDMPGLQIEEMLIEPGSALAGQSLAQRRFHEMGLIVVAVRKADNELVASPSGDCVIEAGSILVVLGPTEQLKKLERFAAPTKDASRSNAARQHGLP